MLFGRGAKQVMVAPEEALPGRAERPYPVPERHAVNGNPLEGPYPDGFEVAIVGLGCFWGAERKFWQTEGVWVTAVGYTGGFTPNPTYEETCTARTGHTEAVLIVFDPKVISYAGDPHQVLGDPRPHDRQPAGRGHRHPVPVGDLHHHRRAGEDRAGVGQHLPGCADQGRPRRDHHRDRPSRGVLLRRGLPPAVPVQGPARLRLPRRDRREVPARLSAGSAQRRS